MLVILALIFKKELRLLEILFFETYTNLSCDFKPLVNLFRARAVSIHIITRLARASTENIQTSKGFVLEKARSWIRLSAPITKSGTRKFFFSIFLLTCFKAIFKQKELAQCRRTMPLENIYLRDRVRASV